MFHGVVADKDDTEIIMKTRLAERTAKLGVCIAKMVERNSCRSVCVGVSCVL